MADPIIVPMSFLTPSAELNPNGYKYEIVDAEARQSIEQLGDTIVSTPVTTYSIANTFYPSGAGFKVNRIFNIVTISFNGYATQNMQGGVPIVTDLPYSLQRGVFAVAGANGTAYRGTVKDGMLWIEEEIPANVWLHGFVAYVVE